jgi:hypothetical protein
MGMALLMLHWGWGRFLGQLYWLYWGNWLPADQYSLPCRRWTTKHVTHIGKLLKHMQFSMDALKYFCNAAAKGGGAQLQTMHSRVQTAILHDWFAQGKSTAEERTALKC